MWTSDGPGTAARRASQVASAPTTTCASGSTAASASASAATSGACASGTANTIAGAVADRGGCRRAVGRGDGHRPALDDVRRAVVQSVERHLVQPPVRDDHERVGPAAGHAVDQRQHRLQYQPAQRSQHRPHRRQQRGLVPPGERRADVKPGPLCGERHQLRLDGGHHSGDPHRRQPVALADEHDEVRTAHVIGQPRHRRGAAVRHRAVDVAVGHLGDLPPQTRGR